MRIEYHHVTNGTIEEFADTHGLTMVVVERRNPSVPNHRYYAAFQDYGIRVPGGVCYTYGNGATPEEAIAEYAREISGQRLERDDRNGPQIPVWHLR